MHSCVHVYKMATSENLNFQIFPPPRQKSCMKPWIYMIVHVHVAMSCLSLALCIHVCALIHVGVHFLFNYGDRIHL